MIPLHEVVHSRAGRIGPEFAEGGNPLPTSDTLGGCDPPRARQRRPSARSSRVRLDARYCGAPHIAQSNSVVFCTSVNVILAKAGGMAPTLTSMAACSACAYALAY